MHDQNMTSWQHSHVFGQDKKRAGESRTLIVIAITAVMMAIEVTAGILFGSMALLADGLHMASHASALGVSYFAYVYARRHAHNAQFSFGTGKINSLAGYTGAVLLGIFALVMAWESLQRIVVPVTIAYNQAILVAIVGLVVNAVCFFVLQSGHEHDEDDEGHHHHDHNLKSATLHVWADALTSLLAILALFSAKYYGIVWMDPLMGIVGAVLVSRWSWGLLKATSKVLLDHQAGEALQKKVKDAIESDGDSRVADLHLWLIGPNIYSAIISIVAHKPKTPQDYKRILTDDLRLAHAAIEVCQCEGGPAAEA